MSDEIDVALRVARALESCGVEYVLGGSVASSMQGEARATNDLDFAVRLADSQVHALVTALGNDFEADEAGLREAVRQRGSHNVFFLPELLKVDFFIRGDTPFDASELARRQRVEVRPGQALFVAAAEDNLLRKLVWFRLGGEVSDRQWRDVLGILRVSGASVDRPYLERWAPSLGVGDLLNRALSQASP